MHGKLATKYLSWVKAKPKLTWLESGQLGMASGELLLYRGDEESAPPATLTTYNYCVVLWPNKRCGWGEEGGVLQSATEYVKQTSIERKGNGHELRMCELSIETWKH